MNRLIAGLLVAASIAAGVAVGFAWDRRSDPDPQATDPTAAAEALIVSPGVIGPIELDMPIDDAVDTGLIVEDKERNDRCEDGSFYRWKDDAHHDEMDVVTREGDVTAVGISGETYRTDVPAAIGVGSTVQEIRETYGAATVGPGETDDEQASLFVQNGELWIGFAFDVREDDLADDDQAVFMEITRGGRPSLVRDGC